MASINVNDLQSAVENALREYGGVVYNATEEGLTAAEKVLISEMKAASPSDEGEFKKSWKGKGKKYKLHRYVGNTKMVKGKEGDIPLSNILEYSTKSPHRGFIKRAYDGSVDKMTQAIADKIKEA